MSPVSSGTILGATESLCPVCLSRLPALRVLRGNTVFLERSCPSHGAFSVPVWRGQPAMDAWRRPKRPSLPPAPRDGGKSGCPFDCGLCPDHGQHTCTAVIEVTQRCDLGCPVCFASAGPGGPADPPLPVLARRLSDLKGAAGECNLQLSGGEPTLREDLPDIVRAARAADLAFVQINTNGLRLGREPGYAGSLARAGLASVFLQFDGSDAACTALRGRPLLNAKLAAIDACAEAGLGVVLVPTVARGVNDRELGEIVRLALSRAPVVRGVHFQPVASFGRHPWPRGDGCAEAGPTLPEMLTGLVEQSQGMLRAGDFHPPGCEHESCSFSGSFLRLPDGRLEALREQGGECCDEPLLASEGAAVSRSFTARQWAAAQPASPLPAQPDDFDLFLARSATANRFSISCMAFQDAWSLDLERVRGCCIHVQADDGRLIPFCLYNLTAADGRTLYRGRCP